MKGKFFLLFYLALCCFMAKAPATEVLSIAAFSKSGLEGWQEKLFTGKTTYRLVQSGNHTVLKAESRDSASSLIKKIRVDLERYPYLNWKWRIEKRLATGNETKKTGDDYAARIYVVIDGGMMAWRTRAVNYVWANRASKGEVWANAFAGKDSMIMALRSSESKTATWYTEKRDVYKDIRRLFGKEVRFVDAIAIMTDTDNSHGQVESCYGDIYFSSE
ncbi:MAG: DUF3047 domain-containing protein [Gammaproteobacteria bacterium]